MLLLKNVDSHALCWYGSSIVEVQLALDFKYGTLQSFSNLMRQVISRSTSKLQKFYSRGLKKILKLYLLLV